MNNTVKNILKILLIGLAATAVRIIGQLSIPESSEQTILAPSIFAKNGTMPLAFTVYGIFAYSVIACMFLIIRNQLGGNRILQSKAGADSGGTAVWGGSDSIQFLYAVDV